MTELRDIRAYNRAAWNAEVARGSPWTRPVEAAAVERARRGDGEIVLTPTRPVPAAWFPPLDGADVLGHAAGDGQQGPILAASGANATVLDNAPRQLAQDRAVAEREGLGLRPVKATCATSAPSPTPRSTSSCTRVRTPTSRRAPRLARGLPRLRPGRALLAGFANSALYLFDDRRVTGEGVLEVRYKLLCADLADLPPVELARYV